MTYDVVVVGGGPVGLASALLADRAGLSAVVLEPRAGLVDKACGEGLMPGGVAALSDLGIAVGGRPFRGICYLDESRRCAVDFAAGDGRGVRRTVLHGLLSDAVAASGIEVVPVRMAAIDQSSTQVRVTTTGPRGQRGPLVAARHLLAADGLHSHTRHALGLDHPSRRSRRYGQRRHYRVAPWSEHVEVHWSSVGEAYVTPVDDDLVGVAVLSRQRRPYDDLLTSFPLLGNRIAGVAATTSVRGAGPLRQRSRRRVAGRVLLVGDAAGYVDALTGEGISVGVAQARAAVDAVVAGKPAAYERGWRQASWRANALTLGLLRTTEIPWARGILVPAASKLPRVFAAAVNELGTPR